MRNDSTVKVGLAQISPVWLQKKQTIEKIINFLERGGHEQCDLIIFGEACLPGYPFWISLTNGAEFNSSVQKEIYAHYVRNSVQIEKGNKHIQLLFLIFTLMGV